MSQGTGHRDYRPYVMRACVEPDDGIAHKVPAVNVDVGARLIEHPSDMRVEQAPERVLVIAVAIDERAVVVATVVGVGVMAPVIGRPGEQRALKRHGAESAQHIGDPGSGLKAFVREIAVEADARSHPNNEVPDSKRDNLNPVDGVCAKPEDARYRTGQGKADQESVIEPLLEASANGNHAGRLTRDLQVFSGYCQGALSSSL